MGKRKFTATQARAALINAGVEMLASVSAGGVGSVTLASAIGLSGVPRPSAYRVFGSGQATPQEAFHEALITHVIQTPSGLRPLIDETMVPIFERARSQTSPEELTATLQDLLSAVATTTMDYMRNDVQSGVLVAALALTSTSRGSDRMREALAESATRRQHTYSMLYVQMLEAFGLRLRQGWSLVDAISVVNDATYGAVLSGRSSGDSDDICPFVARRLTSSFAALVFMATEPDPDAALSAVPNALMSVTPEVVTPRNVA